MKIPEMNALFQKQSGMPVAQMTQQQKHAILSEFGIDPNEFYQELEMSSPCVDTHIDVSNTPDTIGLHSHLFWEILYVYSGSLDYLIGTQRYHVQRGDILLMAPGLSHRPLLLQRLAEPYKRGVLWINADFMCQLQNVFPELDLEGKYLLRTAGTRWEFLGELFQHGIAEAEHAGSLWQAACVGNTIQLLVYLMRAFADIGDTSSLPEKREMIDDVILHIENHLHEKLTLENTARRFLVSESTISQMFRRQLGVSFYRFVTQRRLIAAKSLIMEGETLEQVASKVGFADYSTFYRAFKQEYGISPAHFRTMMQEE